MLHQPATVFSQHINRSHLYECVDELLYLYDATERKDPHLNLPNRAEIEALNVLLTKNALGVHRAFHFARREPVVDLSIQISLNLLLGNFLRAHRLSRKLPLILQIAHCIVFAQLRLQALQIYQRAHRSAQGSKYPLGNLVSILHLDSISEAGELCRQLGLTVDEREGVVVFKVGVDPKLVDGATGHLKVELGLLENVRPSQLLLHEQGI